MKTTEAATEENSMEGVEPELPWSVEAASDSATMRELLVRNGLECPSDEAESHESVDHDDFHWIDCGDADGTFIYYDGYIGFDSSEALIQDSFETAVNEGKGIAWTEHHAVLSLSDDQLETAHWVMQESALGKLDPNP
ncbi:hypothetical protein ACFP47_10130 [Nesterenkonia lacusekhoensis]|uniref:Uncharacterized protein n=1 Tax=Nesterenkonia lacusekhoensis TaxID=150832 RepID=A0ABS4T561_9MICC|nr:hypothetical protein [Nesterenkonia lacusekhoensis]MBP2319558.1 hypothetical protein [Nesterenkonia lacusekhoensis]